MKLKIEDLRFKIKNLKITLIIFISSLFKRKPKAKNLKQMEFNSSTQKMGLSFTDKVRSAFRSRWIKKQ
jgi:hypothetical protein